MHAKLVKSQDKKRTFPGNIDYVMNTKQDFKRYRVWDSYDMAITSRPTPVNRLSLIEELRKVTYTPTEKAQTPRSLSPTTAGNLETLARTPLAFSHLTNSERN